MFVHQEPTEDLHTLLLNGSNSEVCVCVCVCVCARV